MTIMIAIGKTLVHQWFHHIGEGSIGGGEYNHTEHRQGKIALMFKGQSQQGPVGLRTG